MSQPLQPDVNDKAPWYRDVTRYQWIVLLIASLGWVFDVFEGQIFVASMREAMPSLVSPDATQGDIALYDNIALGAFLLGGALGGILFGMLSDRIGRKRTMSLTIIMYSLFTCVSAFSQEWWHLAGFRFLVAMGVGGEWAVASSLVAEVFPKRARARVLGIFHASSVFGTYLAVAAGTLFIGNPYFQELARQYEMPSLPWRLGFAVGVLPALLIIWIRRSLREPDSWIEAHRRAQDDSTQKMGAISELFGQQLILKTFVGVTLATVGLATFWGAHIYGKDVLQAAVKNDIIAAAVSSQGDALNEEEQASLLSQHKVSLKRWEMLGMFLVTTGGGIGLLSFGPLCERIGRRGAFLLFHLGGLASAIWLFQADLSVAVLYGALPIFGFWTLGMHAGYAIYLPELYPTRVRGTGTGFCFNAGRIAVPPILLIHGLLQKRGYSLEDSASLLSLLFLIGAFVLIAAPETKGQELPE